MSENEPIARRGFLGAIAGAVGAAGLGITETRNAEASARRVSIWPSEFDPNATRPHWNPRAMPSAGDVIHEYTVDVTLIKHEILPLVETYVYAYGGSVPGPVLQVNEGEWLSVNMVNKTHDFHTIHFHGMELACEMDGVPLSTQWPVGYHQSYKYLFRAQPAGTHYYHCHNMTPLHIQAGLYGALIVNSDNDPIKKLFPYTRDYTLILSEIDTEYVREQLDMMQQMGQQMDYMMGSPNLMKEMNGKMMGWFTDKSEFLKAIKNGYIPPYVQSMTGYVRPMRLNYFMINGKSYPMTEELHIKMGEYIRVRLIGAGMMPHFMHLHGHDFWHVAQDGAPLASPVRHNTIQVSPGSTTDIIIEGTNPGNWHFHDHSDYCTSNNGVAPGGMMTMLMYEDAADYGFTFKDILAVNS